MKAPTTLPRRRVFDPEAVVGKNARCGTLALRCPRCGRVFDAKRVRWGLWWFLCHSGKCGFDAWFDSVSRDWRF